MLSDRQLMKISLSMALLGLFGLAAIAYYVEPPEVAINSISDTYLGKVVSVKGISSDVTFSKEDEKEALFFTLSDSTGSIKVVHFSNNLILEDGDITSVTGKVSFYQNKYEIVAESVRRIYS